jgi:hypothetical protein
MVEHEESEGQLTLLVHHHETPRVDLLDVVEDVRIELRRAALRPGGQGSVLEAVAVLVEGSDAAVTLLDGFEIQIGRGD